MLLDSHVAIWATSESSRLGDEAKGRITSETSVFVSAATVWELTIKSMIGKLTLPPDFPEGLWDFGFEPLDVSPQHASGIDAFPGLIRHDPFDRVLLSQSRLERIDLLTVDSVLLGLELAHVVDART